VLVTCSRYSICIGNVIGVIEALPLGGSETIDVTAFHLTPYPNASPGGATKLPCKIPPPWGHCNVDGALDRKAENALLNKVGTPIYTSAPRDKVGIAQIIQYEAHRMPLPHTWLKPSTDHTAPQYSSRVHRWVPQTLPGGAPG